MKIKVFSTLLALVAITQLGCGSSQPSSVTDSYFADNTSVTPGPNLPTNSGTPVTSAQLQGSWLSTCASSASLGRSGTNLVNFSGSQMTQTITNYPNIYCSGASDFVTVMSGSFMLGGASSMVSNATNLSGSISQVLMRPTTTTSATSANAQAYCGYTDWAVNVSKSITLGSACLNGLVSSFTDLVSVAGTQLYFGNDSGTGLDTSAAYIRQ